MTSLCSLCPLWLFIHMKNVVIAVIIGLTFNVSEPQILMNGFC
jgi:hypothetical protein